VVTCCVNTSQLLESETQPIAVAEKKEHTSWQLCLDAGMVGRLGTQQLGAVSVASLCISFATFLFSFLLFLTTPEIAAAVVRNDKAEVSVDMKQARSGRGGGVGVGVGGWGWGFAGRWGTCGRHAGGPLRQGLAEW
jgi:hypothetical protein